MRKYFFISLAAVLIIGLLLSGCAKTTTSTTATTKATTATTTTQAATTPTTTTPTVTPQYGGTLKIISNPGVTNLGYPGAINGSNDGSYRQPALEELLTYDLKGSGKVVPWLATGWAYNSDFTTLTFTLQKGVKFHDGTPFNAAAAKFSLDLILNSTLVDLKTVSSIEAVDDYTLRLNLKTYDSALLISLASYLCPMVSPTAVQAMGKDAAMLHPVGTGPFKFVSYTRDVGIKYEKFTDYWQKGKPYLDALEFVFISDPVTQLASLKAGEAQILRAISTTDAAALKATGKYTLATQEMAVDCLAGDSAHPDSPYAKLQVRQAIAYAIDNAAVAQAVGQGFFTPCNQLISPRNLGYNPNIVGYPYNVQKAKDLLTQAGYPNGFDTKLSYRAGAFEGDYCTLIQGYLKPAGINVAIDLADMARFNDLRVKGFQNQMVFYTMPAGAEKDMTYYFRDRLSDKGSMFTTTTYFPPEYLTKLPTVNVERDDAKRLAALQDLDKIASDQLLVVPVQVETAVSATSTLVHDSDVYTNYAMCYHPENVWLSK